ncbi:hypothetical protein MASR1M50_09200 [Burkholderiales bacterium]
MGALVGGALPGGMTMTQSGGGVQVGHSSGPVTVAPRRPANEKRADMRTQLDALMALLRR